MRYYKPEEIPAYVALSGIVAALEPYGYLRRFKTDFMTHDLAAIDDHTTRFSVQTPPFLWAIGASGTYIIWLTTHGQREVVCQQLAVLNSVADAIGSDNGLNERWYHWDGTVLHPVLTERIREIIREQRREE